MQNRFNFNVMELNTYNYFEYAQNLSSNLKNVDPTCSDQSVIPQDQILYQKSMINLTDSYEISFENAFMDQHQLVFKRELQNYMESMRIYLQINDLSTLKKFSEGLHSIKTNMTVEELLIMTGGDLQERTKKRFMEELKVYEKLKDFLNVVVDNCPSELAVELVHVSHQVLDAFLNSPYKDNVHVNSGPLLEIASSKASNLTGVKILNLSCSPGKGSLEHHELLQKYQRFIDVYCATTILTIGRFFLNPFSEDCDYDGFKRPLSPLNLEDESDSLESPLRKQRKFSF